MVGSAALAAAVLGWSSTAFADWGGSLAWVSVGGNLGTSHEHDSTNFLVGLEGSAGGLRGLFWGGGYLDAVLDTGTGDLRFSIGPELGILCVGLARN